MDGKKKVLGKAGIKLLKSLLGLVTHMNDEDPHYMNGRNTDADYADMQTSRGFKLGRLVKDTHDFLDQAEANIVVLSQPSGH